MTANEFVAECVQRTILPEIALEQEAIRSALSARDDERVRNLLDEAI